MQISHRKLVSKLKSDTTALALTRGRRVGQPGHDIARDYLIDRLEELELEPFKGSGYALNYEGKHPKTRKNQVFSNLVGVIPGRNRKLAPILLGAHYDSVIDAPCADDNATSVAMNLAIAERFQPKSLERDLIIALFDAEEPPHFQGSTMGSTRFHEDHCAEIDFAGVIISDLIGHDLCLSDLGIGVPGIDLLLPHARKTVFVTGAESNPAFPGIVEAAASETSGLRVFPTLNSYIGNLSDHHTFEKQGQPFLFLSCAQGKYYHDEHDDLSWINFGKLARITEFVSRVIRGMDDSTTELSAQMHDPYEFELRMIRKAVGPALPLMLKSFGEEMPQSREDLNRLIGALV